MPNKTPEARLAYKRAWNRNNRARKKYQGTCVDCFGRPF